MSSRGKKPTPKAVAMEEHERKPSQELQRTISRAKLTLEAPKPGVETSDEIIGSEADAVQVEGFRGTANQAMDTLSSQLPPSPVDTSVRQREL